MLLYVMIMACGMFFMHTHKLNSGRIVIHIHPYPLSSDPSDNSNHESEKEIVTLDMTFFQSYFNPAVLLVGDPVELLLTVLSSEPALCNIQLDSQVYLSLRGPPMPSFI